MKHHASLEMAKASSRRMVAEETYGIYCGLVRCERRVAGTRAAPALR